MFIQFFGRKRFNAVSNDYDWQQWFDLISISWIQNWTGLSHFHRFRSLLLWTTYIAGGAVFIISVGMNTAQILSLNRNDGWLSCEILIIALSISARTINILAYCYNMPLIWKIRMAIYEWLIDFETSLKSRNWQKNDELLYWIPKLIFYEKHMLSCFILAPTCLFRQNIFPVYSIEIEMVAIKSDFNICT